MESSLLAGWDNFYVITGGAAGGLTGLTFVVITLAADAHRVRPVGVQAFVSPTIVHFGAILALGAYLSMPRHIPILKADLHFSRVKITVQGRPSTR